MNSNATAVVYVVLLHYNGVEDTRRCLNSLRGQGGVRVQPVVVDNGSLDDGWKIVEAEYPEVDLIKTGKNLGFTGGNNVGIRHSLEQGADWVLLLNNDTELHDAQLIRRLIETGNGIRDAGIVCPTVWDANNGVLQDTFLMPPPRNLAEHLSNRRGSLPVKRIDDNTVSIWGAAAVSWLIPRQVFEEVGGLDEAIFIYGEDNDFCARIHETGRRVILREDLVLHHFFSSLTNPSLASLRNRGYLPNRMYIARKHGASLLYRLILLTSSVGTSLKLLRKAVQARDSDWRQETKLWVQLCIRLIRETSSGGRHPDEPEFS